jgi:hypothetical protein
MRKSGGRRVGGQEEVEEEEEEEEEEGGDLAGSQKRVFRIHRSRVMVTLRVCAGRGGGGHQQDINNAFCGASHGQKNTKKCVAGRSER